MSAFPDWIQITISEEKKRILPDRRDLRILYVYEGRVSVHLDGRDVSLRRDDFYVINRGDATEYRMEQPGFIGMIRIRYSFAEEYLELSRYDILCSSLKEQGIGEERIGAYLRNIFSNGMSRDPASEALVLSDVYRLLYMMREHCRVKKKLP